MRFLTFFLFFLTAFGSILPVHAYYPLTWDDLMYRMREQVQWQRVKLETVVQVFAPFAENIAGQETARPVELPAKSYRQTIYWKNDEILVVETHDEQSRLLHLYYEYNDEVLAVSLNDNRTFATEDIMPHHLRFLSSNPEQRSKALQEAGIISKQIAYHLTEDNHVFLRIGDLDSGHFALLNPKTYHLYSLHNRIWKGDENWWDFQIVFKKYKKYRQQLYPEITEYYLDKRLFKRTTVSKVRTLSNLPIKKLKERALQLRRPQTATLKNDYAL